MSKKTQQIAIAFCYFETLSAPPELEWDGYDDSMERFLGLRKTTVLINQCCAANQKILLGISAAHSLLLRLNLTVSSIFAFKQGNNDLESPWAKSRLKWYRFYRNESGQLDPNGSLFPEQYYVKKKFGGESRFSFGCGIAKIHDETFEGRRCKAFMYFGSQDNGYLRIIDPIHGPPGGAPTSKRIIENINKCIGKHLLDIIAAQGAIVPGLGSHHGH
ncbi:hypothetical protein BB559_002690 [Furculomyces boomerangus]|uniref:Uncharacterized protein n=1 Tax=Furculomyces boomerangus TaxID=61424 RepID=A0A2T9YT92_9FUNG|nr:hypothetical protein BB559_002690 [Furculomyces boomerangus]